MKAAATYYAKANAALQYKVQDKSASPVFSIDNSYPKTKSVNIWTQLTDKYDIRHASFDELCELSTSLYDAGEISLFDHAMFTFDWKRAAADLAKTFPDAVSDLNLTPADAAGNRDWIAEFEARAKRDFRTNNIRGYVENQKLSKILRQLSRG